MKIHIVAGILIGYFNASRAMIVIAALLWAIFFCAFMLRSYKGRKQQYLDKLQSVGKDKQFFLPAKYAFYVYEFVCAAGISYLIGLVVFAMKGAM
ncbi:hypothetical protein [Paenibacillus ginsengarvi]|nr:hypothetical protein [Paenibacillus ginsengarvi]